MCTSGPFASERTRACDWAQLPHSSMLLESSISRGRPPFNPQGGATLKRAYVASLAILAIGLIVDGAPGQGASAPASALVSAADDAVRIGVIVAERNPSLSDAERMRIGRAIIRSAAKYELDPDLVTAVLIVESGGRPWARSPKGAIGLMQVMPYMVTDLRLAGNLTTIENNVEAGCSILSDNIRRLGEDDGISAYFWGSNIRGVAYLDRVREERAALRQLSES
jgi:soluble lytic murein transglycosylase-like protein